MPESHIEPIDRAKAEIERARRENSAEISQYPTPIAGFDVQFAALLAQRHKLSAALAALSGEVHIPTPRNP